MRAFLAGDGSGRRLSSRLRRALQRLFRIDRPTEQPATAPGAPRGAVRLETYLASPTDAHRPAARRRIAFLFLGETLLIPHLWPIAESLAALAPDLDIDLWAATSVHEAMLRIWSAPYPAMRVRRAPLFRALGDLPPGVNPQLAPKLTTLALLAPRLIGTRVAVCAEQTSLWIPALLPFQRTRFVKTSHGVGSMSARDNARRRAARLMLVPSERERQTYLDRSFDPGRVLATGYVKAAFAQHTPPRDLFRTERPILLYTPHWQPRRSSWWAWGREIVAKLAAQDRWNVILAPHQRLVEQDPAVDEILRALDRLPHMHCDTSSFAMVDGSYTAAADLYLGDTSSQVVEYLATPRPCVFLNAQGIDWRSTDDHDFWRCGDVVDQLADLDAALDRAGARHALYAETQRAFAMSSLGDTSGLAPIRCAREIIALARG